MQKKDITTIVITTIVSAVLSFIICNLLITSPKNRQEKVEVVKPITAEFKNPSDKYFNDKSINPTQLITIGNDTNNQPFKSN